MLRTDLAAASRLSLPLDPRPTSPPSPSLAPALSQGTVLSDDAEHHAYAGKADVSGFLSDMRSAAYTATLAETASSAVAYLDVRALRGRGGEAGGG